jgi:hypothetical protein
MISSEVQRTLVKSPPELWAELSDPTALARHLGELGEIRITRVEPECMVEWAAKNTTGTVSIKPSGWGTNVKLTATRELTEPAPEADAQERGEGEPVDAPEPRPTPQGPTSEDPVRALVAEPEAAGPPQSQATVEPQPQASAEPEPEAGLGARAPLAGEPEVLPTGPEAASEPVSAAVGQAGPTAPVEQTPEPKRRLGFFARLFGRGRMSRTSAPAATTTPATPTAEPTLECAPEPPDPFASEPPDLFASEPPDPFAAVREALAPESFASSHPFAALPPPSPSQPVADGQQQAVQASQAEPTSEANEPTAQTPGKAVAQGISAELMAAEDVAAEEVTAVLTAVLDRLGAAHHRPFSRA